MTILIKRKKTLIGEGVHFRELVDFLHSRKYGLAPTDLLIEKEPIVLHLERQMTGQERQQACLEHFKPQTPLPVTHFSNNAKHTPTMPYILIVPFHRDQTFSLLGESRGVNYLNQHNTKYISS